MGRLVRTITSISLNNPVSLLMWICCCNTKTKIEGKIDSNHFYPYIWIPFRSTCLRCHKSYVDFKVKKYITKRTMYLNELSKWTGVTWYRKVKLFTSINYYHTLQSVLLLLRQLYFFEVLKSFLRNSSIVCGYLSFSRCTER